MLANISDCIGPSQIEKDDYGIDIGVNYGVVSFQVGTKAYVILNNALQN